MLHIDISKETIKAQLLNHKDGKACKKKIDRLIENKIKQKRNETHADKKGQRCKENVQMQSQSKQNAKTNVIKQKPVQETESSDEFYSNDESWDELVEAVTNTTQSGYDICIPLYVTAAIDSVDKMIYYFAPDPKTGKSRHDPNGRCLNDGSTPLHLAIRAKQLDVVKVLLQYGADLHFTDNRGENVLMRAIRSTDANMVNTVWPYKTDEFNINHTNIDGFTALHIAAMQKWECCLSFLLQNNADPNIQDKMNRSTPLMIAAGNGDTKMAENLLRAGAEVIIEDAEGFTCIFKAFDKKQIEMMKFLLRQITEEEKELFIKARLDYILEPPIADEEKALISDMYFPLLAECTNHTELKPAFYNQKAIHRIAFKIEEHIQSVDIVMSGSHLLFCIMFRLSDTIDPRFLRQYLHCKGPDLTIEVTKYYTEVWKMSERSIITVFLPMIGLAVIPEGRTWIKKHYLSVSEYINFFKKENLKQYIAPNPEFAWCLTKVHFGKIYKVWNTFYDVVNAIQTEERERNMNELLDEEEREKERLVKKKQKKKQKRQDKLAKEPQQLYGDEHKINKENNKFASTELGKSCTNENAKTEHNQTNNFELKGQGIVTKSPAKATCAKPEFPTSSDQWTTVQPKRHVHREKQSLSVKLHGDKINPNVVGKQTGAKDSRRKKQNTKVQSIIPTQTQSPVSNCTSKARWADIAKVKPKLADNKNVTVVNNNPHDIIDKPKPVPFVPSDFPTLGSKSPVKMAEKENKSEKTGKFTFYFHEESIGGIKEDTKECLNDIDGRNEIDPTTITFLGEPIDESDVRGDTLSPCNLIGKKWTWGKVAEIGECIERHVEKSHIVPVNSTDTPTESMEHYKTIDCQYGNDEIYIDTAYEIEAQNAVEENHQYNRYGKEKLQLQEHDLNNTLDQSVPFQVECDGDTVPSLPFEIKGSEVFIDTDESFAETMDSIPKWAEELDDFEDENAMATEYNSAPFIFETSDYQDAVTSVNIHQNDTVAEDILYTDPAIIGCGGLHKPQEPWSQTETQNNYFSDNRKIQQSRILGTLINTNHGDTARHNESDSSRGHKGWSKKRRMKPKIEDAPTLSTRNWSFGDKLLENTQQLERDMQMEGVCYPESLRDNKEQTETHFFPSFHDGTRLSAEIDPRNFSLVHRLQVMQLAERQEYIDKSIKSTQDETLFAYYASCAGLNKLEYYQLIDQMRHQSKTKPRDPLRELVERQQNQLQKGHHVNNDARPTGAHGVFNEHVTSSGNGINANIESGSDGLEDAANNLYNYQSYALGCKHFQTESKSPILDPRTLGIPLPANKPDVPEVTQNQANIYTIQAAQSAMQKDLMNQIQDLYKGMLKDKIKSMRWRDSLWSMRNIPVDKQLILSKMVIPVDERDRCYISVNRSHSTVLGFLTDGTEVAIRIIDGQSREFAQKDLQYMVDIDVSKYFIAKYRDYCFHDGFYYIALDLYEDTLTDHLVRMKQEKGGRDRAITNSKLIWQLLRGLESLHQSCLMVHGELRPDNVVVDTQGNVRITGYGISRNVSRDEPFVDYSDEDKCWLAPEVLVHKQKVSFKSDIWVAGMLIYYILSDGKNPFGVDIPDIIWNISNQGYAMSQVNEEAGHLLCLMMSINKSERPCISEALKHPYFWGQEKQLRFIIIAGSDVLRDVKSGVPMSGAVKESMISIIGTSPCHLNIVNWMPEVEPVVLREMKTHRQYKNNAVELVLFVYNCCTHFETLSETVREIIEEPCKYFLSKFPTLFMTVYRAIRTSSRAERTCYKAFW